MSRCGLQLALLCWSKDGECLWVGTYCCSDFKPVHKKTPLTAAMGALPRGLSLTDILASSIGKQQAAVPALAGAGGQQDLRS